MADVRLEDNGHVEEETQEQLDVAYKKLTDLVGQGTDGTGALVTFGKQELSLLQKILSTGTEEFREQQFWRMCSFIDEDEAKDHVAAFYEAKDLGMDTSFNVAYAFALCSANRKQSFSNNLLANILDSLQHAKWATANQGKVKNNGSSSRNPLN